jgi:Spy/CpxP family protein refolding chaperone
MKKVFIVLFLLLSVAAASVAQERGEGQRPQSGQRPPRMNPDEMVKRQTEMMVKELGLNKDQEAKVAAINKKYQEKTSGMWGQMRDADQSKRDEMRQKMQAIQQEKAKEIKALLTAEQAKKYDEMEKRRQEMMQNRRGPEGNGPR